VEAGEIEAVLNGIMHPEINVSIVELGMVEDISVDGNKIYLKLNLPYMEVPTRYILHNQIKEAIKEMDDELEIEIEFAEMTPAERENFMEIARKEWKW